MEGEGVKGGGEMDGRGGSEGRGEMDGRGGSEGRGGDGWKGRE